MTLFYLFLHFYFFNLALMLCVNRIWHVYMKQTNSFSIERTLLFGLNHNQDIWKKCHNIENEANPQNSTTNYLLSLYYIFNSKLSMSCASCNMFFCNSLDNFKNPLTLKDRS
jgi:hypothetical protein